MAIPRDWNLLDSGAPVSCIQERGGVRLEGEASLLFETGGNGLDRVFAHVRASGAFAGRVLDGVHAFWTWVDGGNEHYLGLMLRNRSAASSASGVTAADVTGLPSYFVRVNRFAQIEILRGGISAAQTKIHPAGSAVIAPALPKVAGGYYWRVRLLTLGDVPTFRVSQSALAAPSLEDEAHWTTLSEFADESGDAIREPGYAGLAFLNGGVNHRLWRADRYMDRRYA